MLVTFSSPYSTLPSASIRELVYWSPYYTRNWNSPYQGPSRFFEWLGSPAHPGTSQTNLQRLHEVRSLSLKNVGLMYPDDDEDADSNPSSLSPAATAILLHSFDAITTFKLENVEVLSIGQISEILHAFPKLVELHLIEVQFSLQQRLVYGNISVFEDGETSQPDSGSRCSSAPLLQTFRFHEAVTLDALPFTQLPLIVSLHPLVYNLELVIFLTDRSLSAIPLLLGGSSVQHAQAKELEGNSLVGENGNYTHGKSLILRCFHEISKLSAPARSANHGLSPLASVRGLRSLTLDLVHHEQFVPFLLGLPHDTLETLIFPSLVRTFGTSKDGLEALDRTIHQTLPALKSLKFDVFIECTSASLWFAWKAAELSQDEFQTPVIKEGLLWETVEATYDEIADRLSLCNKEGRLKPLFKYLEVVRDGDSDYDTDWSYEPSRITMSDSEFSS
ncbi:hypothetical protein AAF712_012115 [Marasmius tenuissimus]|uniref:Uncharacterized protein n=1 Tax=Marasmius tenuissimus TaxID=585030 RepID=A0ABR2ZIM3_9AGAR